MADGRLKISVVFAVALCAFGASNGPIRFRNVATQSGLKFVLENHPTPEKHIIESMTGGVAAFDYDGDGLTDVFFANGASIPAFKKDQAKFSNRLFRNEGRMKFRDVTSEAGVTGEGYSMGAAAGDYDNDGKPDLFVAGVRHNILYRNAGGGKFEDVTAKSGIKSDLWSVAAGWFDYDNDGRLDLFVVNYANWTPAFNRFCGDSVKKIRIYCHPKYYEPLPNQLYRNRGDGTFEDATAKSGIGQFTNRGMSLAFADYDDDGFLDVFVTNDNLPNSLFRNKGDGTFEETGLVAGVALLDNGKPVASMGADFRDYDNDARPDISVTALFGETFPLFRNQGKGVFKDATFASKLAAPSSKVSGWTNGLFDFDNDGWKDLFTANAHVNDLVEKFEATQYKNANTVFRNHRGEFSDVSEGAGNDFQAKCVHRGGAFADFNNDGRVDVVVSCIAEPAELWQNDSPDSNHSLIVKLQGTKSNRDGIGARVRVGDQHNMMTSAVGYASSSLWGVHFGLGGQTVVPEVEVRWPSGVVQRVTNVKADQTIKIVEQ